MSESKLSKSSQQLYQLLADDNDGRACKDIPEEVCTALPRNYLLLLISQTATAIADLLSNPKTILTWLLTALGAPASFIALLVPLRESGSMLPQLFIGAWVRGFAKRQGFLLLGSLIQASSLFGMALVALTLQGTSAGLAILLLLASFSLGRGFNSVAQKDVLGKTVPKGRRGRLSGIATTLSGILTALLALAFITQQDYPNSYYAVFLALAALLWLVAALLFSGIEEPRGATGGGVNAAKLAWQNLQLLQHNSVLQRFVLCRTLLLSSALAQPFIVLLAQQQNNSLQTLMLLVLASSVAGALSASIWGAAADRSSKQVLFIAACCTVVGCVLPLLFTPSSDNGWFYPLLFVWLSISHAGVRLGRKTYLVDIASGNQRTDFISVSNSIMGILLLLVGGVAAWLASYSINTVLVFFLFMSCSAVVVSYRLKAAT